MKLSNFSLVEDAIIQDIAELRQWVAEWSGEIRDRQIILLEGEMGVGKTEIAKAILESLGSEEAVSPSFAVINNYRTLWGSVDHVDLYRLKDESDLESTGFWDLFDSSKGLILIEWADRLDEEALPRTWETMKIKISLFKDQIRKFERFERIVRQ